MEWLSESEAQTLEIARIFAKRLKPGAVLALSGNLGSGKTTFIKGLVTGLGLKDPGEVTSPTFAIMHIYPSKPEVYHFDLYRLDTVKEVRGIGFEEMVADPEIVKCVEWAEKAGELMPDSTIRLNFSVEGEKKRKIVLEGGL